MARLTKQIPAGTHNRLIEHYGPTVRTWLDGAEENIVATAARFGLTVDGFHDAGWASAIGVGRFPDNRPVILKAFPDPERYANERTALEHWAGHAACRLLGSDNATSVLLIELIGDTVGGSPRPSNDIQRIANALPQLHQAEVKGNSSVPTLRDYCHRTVLPRIEERASRFGAILGEHTVRRALSLGADLCAEPQRPAMLHTDLYAENIPFNHDKRPIFIDPHPKVGGPSFDWAIWCVYYRHDDGFANRIALCRSQVPDHADETLAWSFTLAVDGALYYSANNDPRLEAMLSIIASPDLVNLGR